MHYIWTRSLDGGCGCIRNCKLLFIFYIPKADSKSRPSCKQWKLGSGNCEENSRSIMNKLQNPLSLSELTQMLETALLLQDPKKQTGDLEKIVEELKLSPESAEQKALQKKTLFELHGRTVERQIRAGIKKLQSECPPTWTSLSSQIVEYRLQNSQHLNQIFDDIGSRASSAQGPTDSFDLQLGKAKRALQDGTQKLKWTYKNNSWTARAVLRKDNVRFAECKDTKKEKEWRRQEKLPILIYHIMNELFPVLGPGVVFIYAAIHGMANTNTSSLRS